MTADEWAGRVRAAVEHSFPSRVLHIAIVRGTRAKARLALQPGRFLDLFFREETGRTDYSLISEGRRIFGMDNLGGWHEHPFHAPDSHQPCAEPSPEEAIVRLKAASDALEDLPKT